LRLDTGLNSLALFSKEGFLNAPLISKKNYLILHNESLIDSLDDSYESFKNFSLATSKFSKSLALNNDYFIYPHSYTRVLDPFRADYEEVLWNLDRGLGENNTESISDASLARISNSMKLRSTTRNAIVSYNAMQKVFKSRLDEGRSHARLADFSNSFTSHNFITAPKATYESILTKNKSSYFGVNLYLSTINKNFSYMSGIYNSLNSTYLDIPFLISEKSDPSRYLWFD
jgi:hypothetical protein